MMSDHRPSAVRTHFFKVAPTTSRNCDPPSPPIWSSKSEGGECERLTSFTFDSAPRSVRQMEEGERASQ
ncbi:hypothetical protein BC938DRAFT_483973 [Jimgerdemannia flammicorona]|uniref:Uncharacterized protein n=1 Tax=Jimgerdemannia flammicorona TaxID=994334 RepID=A0A433QAZ5_9FUNG|nr:hypothetical protein BC938DRAFT_483973 [Jimgerdemannia flammicorona]